MDNMQLWVSFFIKLAIKRWRILLMIIVFITIPLLLIQYAMLKEQSLDSVENWYIFDERNVINDVMNSEESLNMKHMEMFTKLRRPSDYCNLPLAKFYEDENALGKNWRLKNVIIFLRHGQRASSDPMTNAQYEYHINCSLKQFPLFKKNDWKRFLETLNKSNTRLMNFESNARCSENQMTLFGILQMFMLGSRLKKAYEKFLDLNLVSVFSTSYQRSILSGEIIQHLLVKDVIGSKFSKINESPSLIFCRPSQNVSCQCPSLRYYYAKYYRQLNHLSMSNAKCNQLVKHYNSVLVQDDFKNPRTTLSLPQLFDVVASALCASNLEEVIKTNSFCWPVNKSIIDQRPWGHLYKFADINEGILNIKKSHSFKRSQRCFSLKLIIGLWQCFDDYRATINYDPDFIRYAKLAAYPILREIINKVYENNENASNNSEKTSQFLLYVGHDHTIRLLMGALDYNNVTNETLRTILDGWPGFATRIVIEVFENIVKKNKRKSNLKFRFLYNGLDITSFLKFCGPDKNGCDFSRFKEFIENTDFWESILFHSTSYFHECNRVPYS